MTIEKPTDSNFVDDFESAKLKLALLKENFEYQIFFEKLKNDPYKTCPELKRPDEKEDIDYFVRQLDQIKRRSPLCNGDANPFDDICRLISIAQRDFSLNETLDILDPNKELTEESTNLFDLMSFLFHDNRVYELTRIDEKMVRYGLPKNGCQKLKPYQRLILIDLRMKKSQLRDEFGAFIDKELEDKRIIEKFKAQYPEEFNKFKQKYDFGYHLWEHDKSRKRKETWKLRKQLSMDDVAIRLGIPLDSAKKSFYKAYERTQNKKYDKNNWKRIIRKVCESEVRTPEGMHN